MPILTPMPVTPTPTNSPTPVITPLESLSLLQPETVGAPVATVILTVSPSSTFTMSPTPTISLTPTATPGGSLVQNAVAAPNVSDGSQPIRLNFNLSRSAEVKLFIFTLTGELVYQTEVFGNQGVNTLIWEARNQAKQAVASGLYLYVLRANDGSAAQTVRGKIAIIR
jgi:hypothetical protein